MRILIFLLGLWLSLGAWAADNVQAFVLHSYSQEYPWTKRQHDGFMQELRAGATADSQASVEYLDTKRATYSPAYAAQFAETVARKYQGYQPTFIYVSDDNALSFALTHLGRIFPNAPVFFSGINNYGIRKSLDPDRATGVFERKEISPNLELIRQLAPQTRDILLVGDKSETARMIQQEIEAELRKFPDIHATFLSSSRIDRLVAMLAVRAERSIILTTLGAMKNSQGQNISLEQILSAITKAGRFSIFSMEDAYLYPGVLGGYVTSGNQQGKTAAQLVKRYLAGTPLKQIAPIETSPNEYLFDAPTLQQAGLVLPGEIARRVTLLNPLPSFYEAHRTAILLALYGLIFGTVLLLAIYLVVLRHKNRQIALHSQALRESESQLKEAQEVAHLGSWKLDLATGKATWSDQEYRLLGYVPGAVEANAENFMNAVHPDDRQAVMAEMQRAMDPMQTRPYWIEHRVLQPDGERMMEERGRVTFDENNRPLSMLGTTMDITERKRAEEAVRHLNEDLEQRVAERTMQLAAAKDEAERASRAKSDFLSSMSHELRTPMNAILGFSQLLQFDTAHPLSADQRDNVQEIRRAGSHLLELINEVLDLARIEAGRLELALEAVPVMQLAQEYANLMHPMAEQKGLTLSLEATLPEGTAVQADRLRLRQALINLLSNAIKYNRPAGSVLLTCSVEGGSGVRLTVRDTGRGISPDQMARLFQPFERLEEGRYNTEGTGIGLALTKRLVEAMGGQVGVESIPGESSSFWIELPLAIRQPQQDAPTIQRAELPSAKFSSGRVVLHVEDNLTNLHLVQRILASHSGLTLLDARTAKQGIELAEAQQPDLILMDINLPDMDGFAALGLLRGNSRTRHIPVVAISANAMASDIEKGFSAGFEDYLTKPLNIDKFLATIDRQFER